MSLINELSGEKTEQLAVLYCDLNAANSNGISESELVLWRMNHLRAAHEMAENHGGEPATTVVGGWAALFRSTVDALLCAQAMGSVAGWEARGPSLSGGLSAGDVTHGPFGISGRPVWEAISLCRQARPRQVLVADPIKFLVAEGSEQVLLPSAPDPKACWVESVRPSAALGRRGRHGPGGEPPLRLVTASPTDGDAGKTVRDQVPGPETGAGGHATAVGLNVLGWVQVEAGDPPMRRAVMRGSQARAVLSMLALRRGPVHKAELAELLWPDGLPDHWEGATRGLITKIRRFLDEGGLQGRKTLVAEGGYYELRLPPGAYVDRHLATTVLAAAKAALGDGRPAQALPLTRQAVAILQRRLMSGDDNGWFDQVRSELEHERLAALELLAQAELHSGNYEPAKRAATEALALDPYRESSYRLLMETHAAAGSRGEALRTYERCRKVLVEELGVGPAPQTQALYLDLLG
jgi:DNA-binding SARP family transcriptional activator